MKHAFTGANMVIIPAGIPRKSRPRHNNEVRQPLIHPLQASLA